jgi:putative sigma-54 modulation protein
MNTNIKATNMELTSTINDYVTKKVDSLEKFLGNKDSYVYVGVGKTTQHHKNGEYYKAEFSLAAGDIKLFAEAEESDLYAAVDAVREEIARSIKDVKNRKQTLFTRGARSVKKMFKGLSGRNPNTSKYD